MLHIRIDLKNERQGTYQILVDDEPWKEIWRSVFGRRPKLPKEVSDWEQLQQVFGRLEYEKAREYALRRLTAQSYLSSQLHQALTQRGVSEECADRVIEECKAQGLINDIAWTESFIRKLQSKAWGTSAIRQKLQAKGAPRELIDSLLSRHGEEESAQIQAWLEKRGIDPKCLEFEEKQKLYGRLQRRGFGIETIKSCIENN